MITLEVVLNFINHNLFAGDDALAIQQRLHLHGLISEQRVVIVGVDEQRADRCS